MENSEELIKQEFRKQRIEPIFDRFYKSDEFEQGVGFPICKIIVEKIVGTFGSKFGSQGKVVVFRFICLWRMHNANVSYFLFLKIESTFCIL